MLAVGDSGNFFLCKQAKIKLAKANHTRQTNKHEKKKSWNIFSVTDFCCVFFLLSLSFAMSATLCVLHLCLRNFSIFIPYESSLAFPFPSLANISTFPCLFGLTLLLLLSYRYGRVRARVCGGSWLWLPITEYPFVCYYINYINCYSQVSECLKESSSVWTVLSSMPIAHIKCIVFFFLFTFIRLFHRRCHAIEAAHLTIGFGFL